ncbi:MFS transporter [Alloscardovia venturai]|uniref:MFS transporter n=1 Tax=Alloscardovia venturai TaxID=1769421 RepID=A0ABW2Y332_9BIFI
MTDKVPFYKTSIYRRWFTADTSLAIGGALWSFSFPLVAFALTQDVQASGWAVTASEIIGQIAYFFGGTVVDRRDRRKLMILQASSAIIIWGFISVLLIIHALTLPVLVIAVCIYTLMSTVISPASNAMLLSIVSTEDFPQANSVNESRDSVVEMASSPFGGVLYAFAHWLPFLGTVLVNIVGLIASILIPQLPRPEGTKQDSFIKEFVTGWKWAYQKKTIVSTCIVAMIMNFGLVGEGYLIELHLVSRGVSAVQIGFLSTALMLGILLGSIISTALTPKVHGGFTIIISFFIMALVLVPLIFTDNFWVILVSNFLLGLPFPLMHAMLLGFTYTKTPENMQGRVQSAIGGPGGLLAMFGGAVAGWLLAHTSWMVSIILFIVFILAGATISIFSSGIRSIPHTDQWDSFEML